MHLVSQHFWTLPQSSRILSSSLLSCPCTPVQKLPDSPVPLALHSMPVPGAQGPLWILGAQRVAALVSGGTVTLEVWALD